MEKPAPIERPIHELLARRWNPRAIDPSRPRMWGVGGQR